MPRVRGAGLAAALWKMFSSATAVRRLLPRGLCPTVAPNGSTSNPCLIQKMAVRVGGDAAAPGGGSLSWQLCCTAPKHCYCFVDPSTKMPHRQWLNIRQRAAVANEHERAWSRCRIASGWAPAPRRTHAQQPAQPSSALFAPYLESMCFKAPLKQQQVLNADLQPTIRGQPSSLHLCLRLARAVA